MKPLITLPVRDHINGYLRSSLDACGYPWLPIYGSSDLPRVRSYLLTHALRGGYDRVLCVDADIVADPADIWRLAAHPRLAEHGAVTGLYAVRSGKAWACKPLGDVEKDGCRLAEFAGLGFACIMTESLRSLSETMPALRDPDVGTWWPFCLPHIYQGEKGPEYAPEDVALWRRLRQDGTQLWADTNLVVGHQALVTLRSPIDETKAQALPNLDLLRAENDNARERVA